MIFLVFLLVAALRSVVATRPQELDVFSPTITYPTAGAIWHVGYNQTVIWRTSNIPRDVLDNPGMILLGHIANNSENLNIASPLASGFRLRAGSVPVIVPKVAYRDDYVVVLFGDSGNISPKFSIAPPPTE